jgi:hypothetical protein
MHSHMAWVFTFRTKNGQERWPLTWACSRKKKWRYQVCIPCSRSGAVGTKKSQASVPEPCFFFLCHFCFFKERNPEELLCATCHFSKFRHENWYWVRKGKKALLICGSLP